MEPRRVSRLWAPTAQTVSHAKMTSRLESYSSVVHVGLHVTSTSKISQAAMLRVYWLLPDNLEHTVVMNHRPAQKGVHWPSNYVNICLFGMRVLYHINSKDPPFVIRSIQCARRKRISFTMCDIHAKHVRITRRKNLLAFWFRLIEELLILKYIFYSQTVFSRCIVPHTTVCKHA